MWTRMLSLLSIVTTCALVSGCEDKGAPASSGEARASSTKPASSGGAQSGGASAPTTSAAPTATEAPKRKALRELLVGTWLYESVEMPGVPPAAKKQIDAEMKKSTVEFTDKKSSSTTNGKAFGSTDYEVVEEKGNDITIKLIKAKKTEVYTFADDDTLTTTDKELGKVVMKRKR